MQLRSLEETLGQPLFERKDKALVLTEAGQIALEYADSIFRSGEELTDLLQNRAKRSRSFLRVGAASNLSRNFQLTFLRPLITRDDVELIIHSGALRDNSRPTRLMSCSPTLPCVAIPRRAGTAICLMNNQ